MQKFLQLLSKKPKAARRRAGRRAAGLSIERLGDRVQMAGDVCVDPNLWLAGGAGLGIPTFEIVDPPPPPGGMGDPGMGDPGGGSPGAGGDPGLGNPGSGGQENSAPQIVSIGYEWAGNEIVVYGQVSDDGPLGGIMVELGGALGNATTWTEEDGHFSFAADLGTPFGVITAIAIDEEGLASEIVYLVIR